MTGFTQSAMNSVFEAFAALKEYGQALKNKK
jgi:hypothetical protein